MNCVVCGTVEPSSLPWARMCVGWVMNDRASVTIGPGIVAENSIVCRLSGTMREDPLDVGQEAQVEHLVGLVEDEDLDLAEDQVALLGQVEQPAGGADDDLDALLQRLDLRLERAAAVDGLHADAALGAGGGEVAGDLDAQLAGGDDDQRLRDAVAALGRRDDALQHRDAEAEGLAGAGAGLADEVVAGQRQRQGQLLDGEGAGDADVGQRGDDVGVDVEVAEQRAVGGDGGAAELLDLRSSSSGAGAPVSACSRRRSAAVASVDGSVFSVEVSALASGLLGERARRASPRRTCPGRLSRDQFQRQRSQQNRASVTSARETAREGVVQRSSAHRYTASLTARRFPSYRAHRLASPRRAPP